MWGHVFLPAFMSAMVALMMRPEVLQRRCPPCKFGGDRLARGAVLIVCDVLNPDGTPHDTNTRAQLVELLTPDVVAEKPLYGFEQVRSHPSCCPAPQMSIVCMQAFRQMLLCSSLPNQFYV